MFRSLATWLLGSFVLLGAATNAANAQAVQRPGSPLSLPDGPSLNAILQEFLDKIASNAGADAQFNNPAELINFLQSSGKAISSAIRIRPDDTQKIGNAILGEMDRLEKTVRATNTSTIPAPQLASLTRQTAFLFAKIAFEGMKFPTAPAKVLPVPQTPSKVAPAPQAPSVPPHPVLPVPPAPGKGLPMPGVPTKSLPTGQI